MRELIQSGLCVRSTHLRICNPGIRIKAGKGMMSLVNGVPGYEAYIDYFCSGYYGDNCYRGLCSAESRFTTGSFPTTNTSHGCSDRDASHANDHGNGTGTGVQ